MVEEVNVVRYPYLFSLGLECHSGEGIVAKSKRNPLLNIILPSFLMLQHFFTAIFIDRFRSDHLLVYRIVPQGLAVDLMSVNRRLLGHVEYRIRKFELDTGQDK